MNFSLSIQRNIGFGTLLDVGYTGALGRHLWWRRNLNPVPLGANFLPSSADPTQPGRPLLAAFLRPMLGYADVNIIENNYTSNYNSMQTVVRRRFARNFQFGVAWTWSKTLTFVDEDQGLSAAANVETLVHPRVWNYSLASFDRTHVFTLNYLYTLPRPGRRSMNICRSSRRLHEWRRCKRERLRHMLRWLWRELKLAASPLRGRHLSAPPAAHLPPHPGHSSVNKCRNSRRVRLARA